MTGKQIQRNRATARERDGYVCRLCSKHPNEVKWKTAWEGRIQGHDTHHVFSPNDHSIKNLITVCRKCHARLHHFKSKDYSMYEYIIQENIRLFLSSAIRI